MNDILIATNDFPYPANHGGRKDVWNRILLFNKLNYKIDLIVTIKSNPSQDEIAHVKKYVNNLIILNRNTSLLKWISIQPYQVSSRLGLKKVEFEKKYTDLIIEGDYLFGLLDNKSIEQMKPNLIYRMHNNEEKYFHQLSKSEENLLKKIAYKIESFRFRLLIKKYIEKFNNIWFISKDEKMYFDSKYSLNNSLFLPPHIDEILIKNRSYKIENIGKNVLFIGSFFMNNNRDAIKWYLENVHDKVYQKIPYNLTIAGNTRGEGLDWLESIITKLKFRDNITIFDSPPQLDDLYLNNSIFINPMLHGAGVKLKTVEAIQKGLTVVSTTIGIEGTGLIDNNHVRITDDSKEFANSLMGLLVNPAKREELNINAQMYIKNEFNTTSKIITTFEKRNNVKER